MFGMSAETLPIDDSMYVSPAAGCSLDVSPFIYELLDTRTHAIERYEEFVCLLDPAEQEAVRSAFGQCAAASPSASCLAGDAVRGYRAAHRPRGRRMTLAENPSS